MQKIILLLLVLGLNLPLKATTYVYFQNNTSLPLQINTVQTGGTLSASNWGRSATQALAWQREQEILWTSRSSGITNGVDFFFDMRLINGADTVVLRLRLRGTLTHSTMWQSISGSGFAHTWYSDRNFHEQTFQMQGRTFTLKYKAKFTGGDDDVYYTLHEHAPFAPPAGELADSNILNILSYNIYMLPPPIAYTDQAERGQEIPEAVTGYDAIIISEAFYNSVRDGQLLPDLMLEYPYATPVVDESGSSEDGGVLIVSRWPIDTFAQIVFSDCNGSDCLSAKGVMYAKIDKLGKKYHLFGTHTQAWPDPADVNTRVLQLRQLRQFQQSLNIPAQEPVLIGGDLNVDKIVNNLSEYDRMLDSLEAIEPTYLGHAYTYDPTYSYYASGTLYEYLDYVLPVRTHHAPDVASNRPIILRSIADDMWEMYELSDHFAVQARFVYPFVSLQPQLQNICDGTQTVLRCAVSHAQNPVYQWYRNGAPILNATADTLAISAATATQHSGVYFCMISYGNGTLYTQAVNVLVYPLLSVPFLVQSNDTLFSSATDGNQWLLNGQPIAGANQPFFVPTQSGAYSVQSQDSTTGCISAASAPTNFVFIGVENRSPSPTALRLFPNPTAGRLALEGEAGAYSLRLFDLQGREIWQTSAQTGETIELPAHLPALCWVQVLDEKGKLRLSQALRVEK